MEKWDGSILDINATVRALGDKCQGLLGMDALSGCDPVSYPCLLPLSPTPVSYPCRKGKALKVLQGSPMYCLDTKLGEPDATHSDLKYTGTEFFLALYGQKKDKSMNTARYQSTVGGKSHLNLKSLLQLMSM
ncbi:hypothetical protein NHX12_033202 [Muraenolepis orangiensis]|uniref:Uncharacterized protein n=1 Tax=Muraenolepis orangiensis TaxID=630683 RepID=A0A9Q0E179_9TELE|nr:hypothetical protein NHX12_033202 [Muraenolepis orangiensis]